MKGSSNLLEPFIIPNRWCPRPDLNRHGSPHYPLKIACLPGSTTWANRYDHERPYWGLAGVSGLDSVAVAAGAAPAAGLTSGALVSTTAGGVSMTTEAVVRWLER
jgi:hypothetical protein